MIFIHGIAKDPRIHAGGDFGGAGGLCTIADGAADNRHGVHNGMGYRLVAPVQQISDPCSCPHPRADRAAVGGETAYAAFLVDRHQVADQQRPVQFLLTCLLYTSPSPRDCS